MPSFSCHHRLWSGLFDSPLRLRYQLEATRAKSGTVLPAQAGWRAAWRLMGVAGQQRTGNEDPAGNLLEDHRYSGEGEQYANRDV
jgi:hypothetical protein